MPKMSVLFNALPVLLIAGAIAAPATQQQRPNVDLGVTGQFVFRVSQVEVGSPAEAAGLKPGDIVHRVGLKRIHSREDLVQFGASHFPGQTVEIAYERPGRQVTTGQPSVLRATIQLRAPTR